MDVYRTVPLSEEKPAAYLRECMRAKGWPDAVRAVGDVARLAVDEASRAKLRATAAMILAAGAMLAAMAAAFIAFLALRKYGFQPPW
jgi:hypothetical protein